MGPKPNSRHFTFISNQPSGDVGVEFECEQCQSLGLIYNNASET